MYISHSGVCASSMAFMYIYVYAKLKKPVHKTRYGSYTRHWAQLENIAMKAKIDKILNDGLNLSMEFGENWLTDISERLKIKYPNLTISELKNYDKLHRKVNKYAHDFIRNNPIKNGNEISFIEFDKFEGFMKIKYDWIDEKNLNRLYSQSCYYALK